MAKNEEKGKEVFPPVIYNALTLPQLKEYLLGYFMDEIQDGYYVEDLFISGNEVVIRLKRDYLKKKN